MPTGRETQLIIAEEALAWLGVQRQTLYAYVSRGLIRAVPAPNDPHRSLYDARDIRRLAERRRLGRARHEVAAMAIDFGEPVLASALTRITDDEHYYRGCSALALAASATLEEVAGLLWDRPCAVAPCTNTAVPRCSNVAPRERILLCLAQEAATSVPETDQAAVDCEAARLLRLAAEVMVGTRAPGRPIHELFARCWKLNEAGADLIRRALVLSADHELNASAFAVRVVASTGASLPACLVGGLAALVGPRHGGASERVRALLAEVGAAGNARRVVAEWRALGARLSGFGHRLYPSGDPRALDLLDALERAVPDPEGHLSELISVVEEEIGQRPNFDLPMVELERRLGLPLGAAGGIFAVGRVAGWIAHALEERRDARLIRPRARYVGI